MSKKLAHVPTAAAEIVELIARVGIDNRLELFNLIRENLQRESQYFTGADSEQGKAMPINDVIANVQDAYTLGFQAGVESVKAQLADLLYPEGDLPRQIIPQRGWLDRSEFLKLLASLSLQGSGDK